MWFSSGMTLAGALASGCAAQSYPNPSSPTLLSDCLPSAPMFARRPVDVSPEIDEALRKALFASSTLVTLL